MCEKKVENVFHASPSNLQSPGKEFLHSSGNLLPISLSRHSVIFMASYL